MNGHGHTATDNAARSELHQRCLALVRRWQPLAEGGWDRNAARQLAEEVEHVADTSQRLGLDRLNGDALELAAYLCSFIDDTLLPSPRDLQRLARMVEALGADLSGLSATASASVSVLPTARQPVAPAPATTTTAPVVPADGSAPSAPALHDTHAPGEPADPVESATDQAKDTADGPVPHVPLQYRPRSIVLCGLDDTLAPGLASALGERGYETQSHAELASLLVALGRCVPGLLMLEARRLRYLGRIRQQFEQASVAPGEQPALLVVAPDADLGHRLLAMRAGAVAFFAGPVDSLQVLAKLDELLAHTTAPAWRVLLVDPDRSHAVDAARALAERGMTARLAGNAQGALTALGEFRPDVVVIDCDLPDVRGIELTQMIRQQQEYAAVPILLAAAAGDVHLRFDAIAAGGDEFLVKPVKTRHLQAAIASRLRRAHWVREVVGSSDGRDARTGLYSRSVLIEKLGVALGDRSAAVLVVAIDRAQELREKIGLAGLAALDAHIGQLLRAQSEPLDLPAQYKDFHYFLLLHRRSRADITATAERIRFALNAEPWVYNGESHALSASIGMGLLGGEHTSVDAVVTSAEAAQIAAAHLGGNRFLWFEAREAALLPPDPLLAIRAVLSRPLTPEQTQFEFQPIVPLAGKLTGQFELGFRVRSTQHPGVTVPYAELAPVAAECGQLALLDRWLIEHALKVREEQLQRGRQLRLFVPQSVQSLLDPDHVFWLTREMKDRHLSGSGLTLELPCSPLIDAGPRAIERIGLLHQHGVRICLVDFGRDWAAVHALRNISVDYVRLCPDLVEQLGAASSVGDTLLALLRKAHASGAAVIGPATDSLNRAHLLLRLGADYAIGPAFSRPAAQPEFDFTRPLW